MEMTGETVIRAPRGDVWSALNDPDVLKACIPGCERLEKTSPTDMEADVTQKVGPVKARFKGAVTLEDIVEGESYRLVGEGKGGAAGFAKGGAHVRLSDHDEGTLLTYEAEARVGGKLAQLGSRLIDGFARKMADEFFATFKAQVEGPPSAETAAASTDADTDASNAASTEDTAAREPAMAGAAPESKSWIRKIFS